MPKNKRYRGILGTPVIHKEFSEADIDARFAALADHYGIAHDDPEKGTKLVVALARAHVPGFQVRRRAGKHRNYSFTVLTILHFSKLKRDAKYGKRNSEIFRQMANMPFYRKCRYTEAALKKLIQRNRRIEFEFDPKEFEADIKRRRMNIEKVGT